MDSDKTFQLVNALIPKGELDYNKKYVDVSRYYVGLYGNKLGRKRTNVSNYTFDIFIKKSNRNRDVYYVSIDKKLISVGNSMNGNYNCIVYGVWRFDSIRLLMYNSGLIKVYIPGKATSEEIEEVKKKMSYFCQGKGNFLLNDLNNGSSNIPRR